MALNSLMKKSLIAILLACGMIFGNTIAQISDPNADQIDTLSKYEAYSQYYYEDKSFEISKELIPLERYLTFLINGVNRQLKKQKIKSLDKLTLVSTEELSRFALSVSQSDRPTSQSRLFETWKNYQFNELFLKMDKALRIKYRIFDRSSAEFKKKMFEYDVNQAISEFSSRNYTQSKMYFEHIYNFYPYKNMDDILFRIAELDYTLKNFISAEEGYQRLIREFPQSEEYQRSVFRLISLQYFRNDYQNVHRYFRVFKQRYDALADQKNEAGESLAWQYLPNTIFFMEGCSYYKENSFEQAIETFNLIEENTTYYSRAKYLTGQCYINLGDADTAERIFEDILYGKIQTDNVELWSEAAVVSGDIYMNKDDINQAWGFYSLVNQHSAIYPRALIGRGMVRFYRGEYDLTNKLMDELIKYDYHNNFIYVARCLKGTALRELDSLDKASEQYEIVLEESGKKIGLIKYLTERLKLTYLVNEWKKGEDKVMETGDEELLERYWYLRNNAENLLKRAYYAEIIEVDPKFKEYIEERKNILKIANEFLALGEYIARLNDKKTTAKYIRMNNDLINLNDMVRASGYGELQKLPYYYENMNSQFTAQSIDSLYKATSKELQSLEDDLIYIAKALTTIDDSVEPEKRSSMLQTAYNVRQWRTNLDRRISENITRVEDFPELDLTRWSHVAFHKTMVPGDDFNDLKAEQKRVKEVDEFLEIMDAITLQFGISLTE